MIKEFIPEYISNNSVYKTIDFDLEKEKSNRVTG
jgi:hypothetical protein